MIKITSLNNKSIKSLEVYIGSTKDSKLKHRNSTGLASYNSTGLAMTKHQLYIVFVNH